MDTNNRHFLVHWELTQFFELILSCTRALGDERILLAQYRHNVFFLDDNSPRLHVWLQSHHSLWLFNMLHKLVSLARSAPLLNMAWRCFRCERLHLNFQMAERANDSVEMSCDFTVMGKNASSVFELQRKGKTARMSVHHNTPQTHTRGVVVWEYCLGRGWGVCHHDTYKTPQDWACSRAPYLLTKSEITADVRWFTSVKNFYSHIDELKRTKNQIVRNIKHWIPQRNRRIDQEERAKYQDHLPWFCLY